MECQQKLVQPPHEIIFTVSNEVGWYNVNCRNSQIDVDLFSECFQF